MKHKQIAAIIAGVLLLVVVVAAVVHILHKQAYAANWPVTLTLDWNGDPGRDVNATATLLLEGVPIGEPFDLDPDGNFEEWTGTLPDGGTTPTHIRFDWDYDFADEDAGHFWDPPMGIPIVANTAGTTFWSWYEDI